MANLFADIGMGGGISSAVENLANRARQIRMDKAASEQQALDNSLKISQENRAISAETRAINESNLGMTETQQRINLNKIQLAEAQRKYEEDNKVVDATTIAEKSPLLYDSALKAGIVSTASDGTPYFRNADGKAFLTQFMSSPQNLQRLNTEKRVITKQKLDAMGPQVQAMRDKLAKKGEDPRNNPEYMAAAEQYAALNDQYQMALQTDADLVKTRDKLIESGRYTPESIDTWFRTGKGLERLPTDAEIKANADKGVGLKATDENYVLKIFAQMNGGVYDERSGTFSGLSKDKQSTILSGTEAAVKAYRNGEYGSLTEAAAAIARKQGFPVEKMGEGKPITLEMAKDYLSKANGDKAKAREMATKDGYTF